MKKGKLIGLVSSVLVIISAWLPWVKISLLGTSQTFTGFQGELGGNPGLFFIILGILSAIFIFLGKKWSNILAIIFGLITVALSVKYFKDAGSIGEAAKAGFGLYVMLIGSIGIVIGSIMSMKKEAASAAM